MIWQFLINSVQVDEPVGWIETNWSAQRHEVNHGIWFSTKADSYKWVGDAMVTLQTEYETNGADGVADLEINYDCGNGWESFYIGTFDFNTYRKTCGDMCYIEISVNPTTCVNKFLNRVNVDVDMESTIDLDGNAITPAALDTLILKSQNIVLENNTTNTGTQTTFANITAPPGSFNTYYNVFFNGLTQEEINIFNQYGFEQTIYSENGTNLDPNLIENFGFVQKLQIWQRTEDPLNCVDADATINFQIKGLFYYTPNTATAVISTKIRFAKFYISGYSGGAPEIVIQDYQFGVNNRTVIQGNTDVTAFDFVYSNTPFYYDADFLLIYFIVETSSNALNLWDFDASIFYDPVTYFNMELESACDDTTAEAIKLENAFCNLWENYLGSESPCSITCSLPPCLTDFHLTSGVKIRQVLTPAPAKIFLNWEKTFENIRKIFNVGYGFWDNETSFGVNTLDFWYSNTQILDLGSIREVKFTNATEYSFSNINVGYSKYEAEEYNGLDEINTTRKFRRNPNNINTDFDLVSDFIAAGYTWEITRRKLQAKTGTQDWRFDNDIFILHTYQDEVGTYPVQDNIDNPVNIISPTTRYNFLITPIRNLMRWFGSLGSPVPTITNANFTFQSGTGNYVAEGECTSECACDATAIAENETLTTDLFADATCYKPYWKTIYAEFDCPLSVSDWVVIKGDPYGKFAFSCGSESFEGHLIELDYNPNEGLGKFKLLLTLGAEHEPAILMEDSGYVLMEDGSYILLE